MLLGKWYNKAMYKTDIKNLKKQTRVFRFGASTKGGQRANKKETGILLLHIPSGLRLRIIEERSQARNLEIAFHSLQEKLKKLNKPKKKRILTKIPFHEKRKRLEEKKRNSERKRLRRNFLDF